MTVDKELIRDWLRRNVSADLSMSMLEEPPPVGRLDLVRVWLEDNVLVPPTPKEIAISDIRFDWRRFGGSFRLTLDNCALKDRFDIRYEINGKVGFTPPMFCSPLGAPASYAAVVLSKETELAITRVLESVFPRIRAYGLHKDIDQVVDGCTPLEERILDSIDFERKKSAISRGNLKVTHAVGV